MKNILICTIIAFLAICPGLYGQKKAQEEPVQTEKVTLELVYKKEFNEIISADGFPPPEIKQILKDKDIPQEDKDWLLNSLRIEIARKEKMLYTNDGRTIKLPDDLQSITTSKNLKYMIVYAAHTDYGGLTADEVKNLRDEWLDAYKRASQWQSIWEKTTDPSEKERLHDSLQYWVRISDSLSAQMTETSMMKNEYKKFIMMQTEDGKVLWEKDNSGRFYIFDDGIGCALNSAGIEFYAQNGNIRKFYNISIRGILRDVHIDGDLIVLLSGGSNESYVTLLNKDKGKIWEKDFSLPFYPAHVLISEKSERILISIDTITYLYSTSGDLIKIFPHWINHFSFSSNGAYLALLDPDFLEICESSNGNILGTWHKENRNQGLWRCQVSSEMPIAFVTSTKDVKVVPYEDAILLFDKNGHIIVQQEFITGSDVSVPVLSLSPNDEFCLCKLGFSFWGLFRLLRGAQ
ncbi:hypothetical protein IBX73_09930 [candidate division WOR-3 bacterium]|nr:hypothetical protein [candidate division WOR-3 bacterium]